MALLEINWRPVDKDLREFGQAALAMLTGVALLLHLIKGLEARWGLYICGVGLVVYVLSLVWPAAVKPIYLGLMAVAFPIGWVLSHVLMGVVYFLVITPIGLVFRLLGRDLLQRRFDREAKSYWIRRRTGSSGKRYFQQF